MKCIGSYCNAISLVLRIMDLHGYANCSPVYMNIYSHNYVHTYVCISVQTGSVFLEYIRT